MVVCKTVSSMDAGDRAPMDGFTAGFTYDHRHRRPKTLLKPVHRSKAARYSASRSAVPKTVAPLLGQALNPSMEACARCLGTRQNHP